MDKVIVNPAKSEAQVKAECQTWAYLGKTFMWGMVLLTVASGVFGIYHTERSPAICSYEVAANADLSSLNLNTSAINGSIGQSGFVLKGQTFCRDIESVLNRNS